MNKVRIDIVVGLDLRPMPALNLRFKSVFFHFLTLMLNLWCVIHQDTEKINVHIMCPFLCFLITSIYRFSSFPELCC
uniref:Uncharacterized protein n=1 Tax=Anguilla anguilla TaxID=7936 RepID=A0A0E9RAI0_ANGAN